MANRSSPLFKLFQHLKVKVYKLFEPHPPLEPASNHPLALEPMDEPKPVRKTNLALAETSDNDNKNKNVVVVEVEYFHDTYVADLSSKRKRQLPNYTAEGEDPNLRITHYPSNRLH